MTEGTYPKCNRCGTGILIPVNLGESSKKGVIYRCTNLQCNAKFDEHGYSVYNPEAMNWERISEG